MALFRKLFYRKPPDGLLEICEKVYVFDCCFNTDAWEEKNYKHYVEGVMTQLRDQYPDASILVFNFRDGEIQSQIASSLSEYDMTIMEYPRQYEGCPLLPMEMIHHFLRSSESWLSLGLQNLLLTHCELGGWPILAFMLAALLIYRKQYSGEHKTLDMVYKQAPRELLHLLSPLNPIPSQLRYLQYVSRRNIAAEWPPLDRALTMDCVILRMIPDFDGRGGCRPMFRIYGQDPLLVSDRAPKVLFSTSKKSRAVRHYKQAECELIKLDINCHIQGDVVLECISLHEDMEREDMMFRVMFNTAFIRSNILMLNRDEIDILWDAKDQFPKDFRAEVLFSEMDASSSVIHADFSCFEEKDGLPVEAFAKVQEIFSSVDWLVPKRDTAVEVLQHLSLPNAVIESTNSEKPSQNQCSSSQEFAAEDATLLTSRQPNFYSPSSPNMDASNRLVELPRVADKLNAKVSSTLTLVQHGEQTPLSSNSQSLHFSIVKTPHSQSKQGESIANQIDIDKTTSLLTETTTMSPKSETVSLTPLTPPMKTSVVDSGRFPCSPISMPSLAPFLEDIGVQSGVTEVVVPPLEMPSTCRPPSIDEVTVVPSSLSEKSHGGDTERIPSTPPSVEDVDMATRTSPPVHSSKMNFVESTGVVSTLPTFQLSAQTSIQSTRKEPLLPQPPPPPPPPPPADVTLENTLHTTPFPQNLYTAPIKENSVSTSDHSPMLPLYPPSRASLLEYSSIKAEPSSPPRPPSTPPLLNNLAARSSSCHPSPPLPPLSPPTPPFVTSPTKIMSDDRCPPPPAFPLKKNLDHVIEPPPFPPPLSPSTQLSLGSSTTRFGASPPPPPPPPPPPLGENSSMSGGPPTKNMSDDRRPPPPASPLKKNLDHVVEPPPPFPPPLPPSTQPLLGSSTTIFGASPPPPPPFPLGGNSSISGAPPLPPPPPSHFRQYTEPIKETSMPPPPPPPAPASSFNELNPSGSSPLFPSVPPPPSKFFADAKASGLPGPPSPPPPIIPGGSKGKSVLSRTVTSRNNQSKKLKPLHWLKLSRAVSGSLWAETQKSGDIARAPEIDFSELESLFAAANPDQSGRKNSSRASMGQKPEKVQLIDHRRAYNCEIMLSKVKIPLRDLLSSVLSLEDSALDVDQVDNLIKFCPTKEEMDVLKGYTGDKDKLGKCEQFFWELMQVPRIEFKLRVFSFKIQFCAQVSDLGNNLNVVNSAADQIRGSTKLKRIMQTILSLGNALNQGTARGSAIGFRLDSLLKLTETRARNNKMTLMHYLCKVLVDKLPEVLDFWKGLSSLELASKIQLKFLAEEMQAISKGLEKIVQELAMSENDGPVSDNFRKALKEFLSFSEGEVRSLAALYSAVGRNVDALILYFGEDPARCPFEQVISTLLNFVRMFKKCHEENCKQLEFEKKKAEKEASTEKPKMNSSGKENENLLLS